MAVSLQYPAYLSAIYEIGRYPTEYTNQEECPKDRAPAGSEAHSGRLYPIRVNSNPTCLIYPIISAFLQERHLP